MAKYDFHKILYDPDNLWVVQQSVPTYLCPSDDAAGRLWGANLGGGYARGNYSVCFGSGTWLGPNWPAGLSPWVNPAATDTGQAETDGIFRFQGGKMTGRVIAEIKDGTSRTVMASEVISGKDDVYQDATNQGDMRGDWGDYVPGSSTYTHWLTPNSSKGDFAGTFCVDRPPDLPCDQAAGPSTAYGQMYAAARSLHPGGVNAVFADGHVDFFSNVIDGWVWRALSTFNTQPWETLEMQQ